MDNIQNIEAFAHVFEDECEGCGSNFRGYDYSLIYETVTFFWDNCSITYSFEFIQHVTNPAVAIQNTLAEVI